MYESVQIQNFRGFRDLRVAGLTRVNLVVGENNVGKTSLLEALFLLAGIEAANPVAHLDRLRGMSPLYGERLVAEDLLDWMCAEGNLANNVAITGVRNGGQRDRFTFRVNRKQASLSPQLEWELADGTRRNESYDPDHNVFTGVGNVPWVSHPEPVFIGLVPPSLRADAQRLSLAIQAGRRDSVVKALRLIDGRLETLETLHLGDGVSIHARLQGLERMMPLNLMGGGFARLCSLLLAASQAAGYLLLVDEIDTGLHYHVLADMWRVVGEAARELDVQVFATTHSYECMVAASEAFAERPEDLSVHRLERGHDEIIVSRDFGHEDLSTALELRFEVR